MLCQTFFDKLDESLRNFWCFFLMTSHNSQSMTRAVFQRDEDDLVLDKTINDTETRGVGVAGTEDIHHGTTVVGVDDILPVLNLQRVLVKVEPSLFLTEAGLRVAFEVFGRNSRAISQRVISTEKDARWKVTQTGKGQFLLR